jgi:hypothetical protein
MIAALAEVDAEAADGPPANLGIAAAADEPPMIRVILCKVGEKPRVVELDADPVGYMRTLEELLGTPIACLGLQDGIQLCCDRDALIFGLALARRALEMSLTEPAQREIRLRFDGSASDLAPDQWPVSADFILARVVDFGELVDMTEADLKHWVFWLGLDYVLNR